MSALERLLAADDVVLDLDVPTKQRVFEEAGRLFERRHGLSQARVFESLCQRENLGSTGLGQGVAIPHARIRGLDHAVAAFFRLRLAIPFDAPDGKPVSDLFIFLAPERATEQHLEILAGVAQLFSDKGFREQIRNSIDGAGVLKLMAGTPEQ